MVKRILDLDTSDIKNMSKEEKLLSIKYGEGRTLMSEVVCTFPPLLGDISNVELVAAFGADIILLNFYDVDKPRVEGIPQEEPTRLVERIKEYTGRMIGANLEPVDEELLVHDRVSLPKGRLATKENAIKLVEQGIDMVLLTGNPKTGVTNDKIIQSIKTIKKVVGDELIIAAGKMHAAGSLEEVGENLISKELIESFIDAGSDIILIPAPGTIPGISLEYARELIQYCHSQGKLTITSIGTSQEGADEWTIRNIAINSKMVGTDIHHLGDAGICPGVATPENIMAYSIAIRGKRHTYRRMARSVNR